MCPLTRRTPRTQPPEFDQRDRHGGQPYQDERLEDRRRVRTQERHAHRQQKLEGESHQPEPDEQDQHETRLRDRRI